MRRTRAAGVAGQCHQGVHPLAAGGGLAKDMQAIADLRFFDFTQVGIQALQQGLLLAVVGGLGKTQLGVQAVCQHLLQNADAQQLGAARVQRQGFVILVHAAFELLQGAVGFGPGHGGHQVVDDDGLRATLGLRALAGVVDDEGVQVRQRAQNGIRPTGGTKRHTFAGQPLQVAVLAHMHHGIHRVGAAQPKVKSQVVVGGHQVGIVVGGDQVQVAPACGLIAHKHMAVTLARHHEAAGAHQRVLRRQTPEGVDRGLALRRQSGKILQVIGHGQTLACRAVVVGLQVVGDATHQVGHQRIAVLRHIAGGIACGLQGLQDDDGGCGRVQAHAVGQAGIVVGVIGQHQGHALIAIIFIAQAAPATGGSSHKGYTF